MKREYGALALLTLLMLTALWSIRRTDFLTEQIALCLERSERALEREDANTALAALDGALELWREQRNYVSVFLRHSDVDSVSDAFFTLREKLLDRDAAGIAGAFSQLRYRLETVDAMEHISLAAVF